VSVSRVWAVAFLSLLLTIFWYTLPAHFSQYTQEFENPTVKLREYIPLELGKTVAMLWPVIPRDAPQAKAPRVPSTCWEGGVRLFYTTLGGGGLAGQLCPEVIAVPEGRGAELPTQTYKRANVFLPFRRK